jgi:hypothetical protein
MDKLIQVMPVAQRTHPQLTVANQMQMDLILGVILAELSSGTMVLMISENGPKMTMPTLLSSTCASNL